MCYLEAQEWARPLLLTHRKLMTASVVSAYKAFSIRLHSNSLQVIHVLLQICEPTWTFLGPSVHKARLLAYKGGTLSFLFTVPKARRTSIPGAFEKGDTVSLLLSCTEMEFQRFCGRLDLA